MTDQQRITVGAGDVAPVIITTMAGDGDVEITTFYSGQDGRISVQIDTEEHASFRIMVNDGEVASVREGGDVIALPEHYGEFRTPSGNPAGPPEDMREQAQGVVDAVMSEVWANFSASDVHEPADIAADIVQRLHRIYGVWALSEGPNDVYPVPFSMSLYEKCALCHLFVEENPGWLGDDSARYTHLHRDNDADQALDASHAATGSGMRATLDTWRVFGPSAMRERFVFAPNEHQGVDRITPR